MINEYYIIANGAGTKPLVQVWIDDKEIFVPLCVYGIKDHAIVKVQNKIRSKIIHNGQIQRISLKGDTKLPIKDDQLILI